MADKNWRKQQGKDQYFKKAKAEGYRARSAYKLEEINQRHRIIRPGDRVLDIGAAPGSWSQLAVELVGVKGKVVAVDISPIQPLQSVAIVQGDVRDPAIKAQLRDLAGDAPYNAVISDIAPNTTGIGPTDHARSIELSLHAFVIAVEMVGKGGNFVTKVFTGEDFDKLIALTRRYFRRVTHVNPDATRKESKETFIVANNLFARTPLDPDLGLDALLGVEPEPL
jgi:23S rRNA (uridine2552-2'-O)-methyltransferase